MLVTTTISADDFLVDIANNEGIDTFRFDPVLGRNDVLGAYSEAAQKYQYDYMIRVTADCPFVDGQSLDLVLAQAQAMDNFDLLTTKPSFPHGIDYEICPVSLLTRINQQAESDEEREHIFNYIYNREEQFEIVRVSPPPELLFADNFFLDTAEDYRSLTSMLDGEADLFITPQEIVAKLKKYDH